MTVSQTDPSPTNDDATAAEADSPTAHPPRTLATNRPDPPTASGRPMGSTPADTTTANTATPGRATPTNKTYNGTISGQMLHNATAPSDPNGATTHNRTTTGNPYPTDGRDSGLAGEGVAPGSAARRSARLAGERAAGGNASEGNAAGRGATGRGARLAWEGVARRSAVGGGTVKGDAAGPHARLGGEGIAWDGAVGGGVGIAPGRAVSSHADGGAIGSGALAESGDDAWNGTDSAGPLDGVAVRLPGWVRRLRFLVPGAVFVGVRGLGLLIFWWFSNVNNMPFSLRRWDAGWYLAIAQHGYLGVPTDMLDLYGHHTVTTPMVFFPGYPQLVRWTSLAMGQNLLAAAIVVSTAAGIAATYGVARLARRYTHSPRTAFVMVVLFAAAPMSIVYSLAYPEALLCAFVAWALVGLSERRWGLAGICTAAAGYVSPMAAPLILAVVAIALFDLVKGRGRWDAVAALLMAPAGMLGYILWVASVTGRLDGYFLVQKQGWGSGFDFGLATAQWFVHTWSGDRSAFTVLTTWIVVAAIVLLVIGWRRKMPWQLWLFSVLTVVFIVGSSGVQWDKVRLLLVAFPLLLPIAITVARQRTSTMALLLLGFTFTGLWFGAYGLTVWQFSM